MASCSDGEKRHISHSDELLRLPFKPENSKLLITRESKANSRVPSKTYKVEAPSDNEVQLDLVSLSVFLIQERGFVHANDMTSYVTVLNRVKDFLPRMKEAGQQLEKELHEKSPSELDIESVDDSAPYIEMSLALMETEGDSGEDSSEESDHGNCTRDSDEVQTHVIDCGHVTEENFVITKPVKGLVKPVIEEVTTAKKNITCTKKNKKKIGTKKGSRKRKQR